jgi:hypothetical protein
VPAFVTLDEERHFLDPLENFTLIDRIRAANYAKFSFIQRVYAQGLESTGSRSVREVARLILSHIDLGLRLWSRWWLDSILRVAPATGDLQEVLWRAGIDLWPGWALTVTNFQRQDPDIQYVLGGVQMTPLPGVQLTYHMRYDARTEEFREHLLTVRYQAVCYRVDMRFRVREAGDTDFFIQVHLWNL